MTFRPRKKRVATVRNAPTLLRRGAGKRPLQEYFLRTGGSTLKHARLRQALVQAIDDGLWSTGTRLPTEQELTEIAGLSLGTVQRAIKALVEEGRLIRVKGRGTFVSAKPRGIAQPFLHARFLGNSGDGFLPVYPRLVSRTFISDRGPWSDLLKQSDQNVLRIERVLRIDKEFEAFSQFYINAKQFPTFARMSTAELTSGNYKLMLSTEFNLPPIHYEQVMRLTRLPSKITKVLTLPQRTIGAILQITAWTTPSTTVYYHEIFIPPNFRQLRLPDMVLPTGR